MLIRSSFIIIFILSLSCINCGSSIPHHLNIKVENESAIVDKIKSKYNLLRNIDASARMELYYKGKARKGKVYITVQKPDSIILQINSPTDEILSVFISNNKKLMYYDRNSKKCYYGDICPENIMQMIHLRLDALEVAGMLMGLPFIDLLKIKGIFTNNEIKIFKITGSRDTDSNEISMWFKGNDYFLVHMEAYENENLRYVIDFDDFKLIHEIFLFPHRIKFTSSFNSTDLLIKYRKVSINDNISNETFSLECPEGFENIAL